MEKILTAKEFIASKLQQYARGIGNSGKDGETLEKERLIEFAKLHVEQALLVTAKKEGVNENDINYFLFHYPLDNIK